MKIKVTKRFMVMFFMLFMALSFIPITTFAATEISKVEIGAVKYNYYAGDTPEATAMRSGEFMLQYDIEYEYWEEMEIDANGESIPVRCWYSDESKNIALPENKKITTFEEGKSYMYSLSLKERDGYTFANNCEVFVNSVKVNEQNIEKSGRTLFITAIKTIKPTKPATKEEIEVVEINNSTLNFKDGDKPVFTGTKSDSRYKLTFEAWRTDDAGVSSEEWFNNDDHLDYWGGKLITTFDKSKTYTYELYLVTSAEGSEKWIFGPNTKLKINGKEAEFTRASDDNEQAFTVKTKITMIPTYSEPEKPVKKTVKEIQSIGKTKAKIEFSKEVSGNYELDVKPLEITKNLTNKNVKYIVDINLLEDGQVVKINDTKMKIRIALPENLKGFNNYEVVYISNDEIKETIPATVEDGYIVFETSHLSQYGIVATNVEGKTEQVKNESNNPKTGDNSNIFLWTSLFATSVLAMIGITVYNNKKKCLV